MLSAGCSTPESEIIVEVTLAQPYNADSAGLEKGTGTWYPTSKWCVCTTVLVFIHLIMIW